MSCDPSNRSTPAPGPYCADTKIRSPTMMRRRGIDRCGHARAPGPLKLHLTGRRIEPDKPVARQKHRRASPADRRRHARRIARLIVGGRPEHFAGLRVERHDAGIVAADVRDDSSVFDERRAGRAEEALRHAEAPHRVLAPERVPLARSTAWSWPSAPNVYTTPSATTGTARGPSSNPKSSR